MHKTFYLHTIVYYIAGMACLVFVISYFQPAWFRIGWLILSLLGIAILTDAVLVYSRKKGITAVRETGDRFSIGDLNKVVIRMHNHFGFPVHVRIIDEVPVQFQERSWVRKIIIQSGSPGVLEYDLKPLSRGEYIFESINVFVPAPLRLVSRRFIFPSRKIVKVYPSYLQMRRFQLLALSNRLQEAGVRKIRKIGHSMEFEQIRDYVRGDDYRTINWKATARKSGLMVNNYTDEKSQQVYCLINKGRVMKMPFAGMTLLDYAINAALVLSNVALVRQDRAGLICFEKKLDQFIPADKKPTQMNQILESLYRQQTGFQEPDLEQLFSVIRHRITQRSLLVLFTNFESIEGLQRVLPTFRKIARYHLLLIVFFENTELKTLMESRPRNLEDIYIKTIAEKFAFEKRRMVKELHQNGILSILTTPEHLTVNTINKYLELKTRRSI